VQGIGAVNISMRGESKVQPVDISDALEGNLASISIFDSKIFKFDLGLFSLSR
jgi:long-chain fatty acid transport protein